MLNCTKSKKGYLLALIAGTSWAFLGVFVKLLNGLGFESMTISSFRPTMGIIFYLIITLIKDPKCFKTDLKGLLFFACYGIFALDGMFISSSYAVKYTGVATASVLLFINPIIVVILSYFVFKEKFTLKKFIALTLTLIGCCLVVRAYDSTAFKVNFVGIVWGIISGITVALQNILGKIAVKKYSQKTFLVYTFLFGAIFLWFFVPPWTLVKSIKDTNSLLIILALGLIATILPNEAIIRALKYVESGKVSIVASVEPLVASILAFIFFDEMFEGPQLIGMALIITSILLIQLNDKENTDDNNDTKLLDTELLALDSRNSNQ